MKKNWDDHFTRIKQVTERLIQEKEKRNIADGSASGKPGGRTPGVSLCKPEAEP